MPPNDPRRQLDRLSPTERDRLALKALNAACRKSEQNWRRTQRKKDAGWVNIQVWVPAVYRLEARSIFQEIAAALGNRQIPPILCNALREITAGFASQSNSMEGTASAFVPTGGDDKAAACAQVRPTTTRAPTDGMLLPEHPAATPSTLPRPVMLREEEAEQLEMADCASPLFDDIHALVRLNRQKF